MFYGESENALTGSGPTAITLYWTPTASVVTQVFGANRENATVSFYSGSAMIYSATLLQTSPSATLPELILGTVKIASGTTLLLGVPTPMQNGSVLMNGTITVPPTDPTPYKAFIATWALTSTASAAQIDEATSSDDSGEAKATN